MEVRPFQLVFSPLSPGHMTFSNTIMEWKTALQLSNLVVNVYNIECVLLESQLKRLEPDSYDGELVVKGYARCGATLIGGSDDKMRPRIAKHFTDRICDACKNVMVVNDTVAAHEDMCWVTTFSHAKIGEPVSGLSGKMHAHMLSTTLHTELNNLIEQLFIERTIPVISAHPYDSAKHEYASSVESKRSGSTEPPCERCDRLATKEKMVVWRDIVDGGQDVHHIFSNETIGYMHAVMDTLGDLLSMYHLVWSGGGFVQEYENTWADRLDHHIRFYNVNLEHPFIRSRIIGIVEKVHHRLIRHLTPTLAMGTIQKVENADALVNEFRNLVDVSIE